MTDSQGYSSQHVRVEIESSRYEKGQLLVTGTAMSGERFEDLVWYEPHGFHSRPHAGTVGWLVAPGGRRDMGLVMAASDPQKLPQIEPGEAAMYDNTGNVVKLTGQGWEFNMDVKITGNLTIEGNIDMTGNITAGGSIVDGDGNNGA